MPVVIMIVMIVGTMLGRFFYDLGRGAFAPSPISSPRKDAKFDVGDCFTLEDSEDKEAWEDPPSIYRVKELGKKKYRVDYYDGARWKPSWTTFSFRLWDDRPRIECPGGKRGSTRASNVGIP